jgi:hypothetical protein
MAVVFSEDWKRLADFRKVVAQIASDRTGQLVVNSEVSHASVVVSQLFRIARNEVLVSTHALPAHVFSSDGVIQDATAFLERNPRASIKILTSNPVPPNHEFFKALKRRSLLERCSIRLLSDDIPYFVVADGMHFRFEPDKAQVTSIAQFGNETMGGFIQRTFNELYSASALSGPVLGSALIVPPKTIYKARQIELNSQAIKDLVQVVRNDRVNIYQLPPDKVEEIAAYCYDRDGYQVFLTGGSGDAGRDFVAIRNGRHSEKVIASVKRYAPHRLVNYDDIRALRAGLTNLDRTISGVSA